MSRRLFVFILFLAAGMLRLAAQDIPVSVPDGPLVRTDSLKNKPQPYPMLLDTPFLSPALRMPSLLPAPPNPFETKEQRAARLNATAFSGVMESIDRNLYWYRLPKYTAAQRRMFFVLGLFLSNPYGFRDGYVPMMNPSFPFIYAKAPGMAPYDNPCSPEYFPQTIRTEYDFATGTYKTVMVDWEEYQKSLSKSLRSSSFGNGAIPLTPVTPGDRIVR